ncbi:MAG: hypothetical protein MUP97_11585 [Acidimicrobiia bacterium]|nr:hypothetical protein [Acidimicrobiia bacterium]
MPAVACAVIVATRLDTAHAGGRVAIGALSLLLAWAAGWLASGVTDPEVAPTPFAGDTRALLHQLGNAVPEQPFIVHNVASARRGISGAIFDELHRRDLPARVDEEGRDVSVLTELPGARVVARTTPLDRADEAELVRLQRALAHRLEDLGRGDLVSVIEYSSLVHVLDDVPGVDHDDIDRIARLTARAERGNGYRCAVISFRPTDAPPLGAASAAGS